ncbi:MAG: hypothetical protein WDZ47_04825 [Bacteroidales bacterium]
MVRKAVPLLLPSMHRIGPALGSRHKSVSICLAKNLIHPGSLQH